MSLDSIEVSRSKILSHESTNKMKTTCYGVTRTKDTTNAAQCRNKQHRKTSSYEAATFAATTLIPNVLGAFPPTGEK